MLPPAVQTGPTVADVVDVGCVTTVVDGLSRQIIEELRCLEPSAFVELPPQPNLEFGPAVFPYLVSPARQALLEALNNAQRSHPNLRLVVNSMYRSAAQQYLLRRWSKAGKCNIAVAAAPGRSRHESGLSVDIQQFDAWRPILEASRFKWLGAGDPVHFDYVGTPEAPPPDLRGLDVRAFQRLWNRNFPDDAVVEDGDFGEETERRMERSPSGGFTRGADCGALH